MSVAIDKSNKTNSKTKNKGTQAHKSVAGSSYKFQTSQQREVRSKVLPPVYRKATKNDNQKTEK